MGNKVSRKTSPGFADPSDPVAIGSAATTRGEGQPSPVANVAPTPQAQPAVAPLQPDRAAPQPRLAATPEVETHRGRTPIIEVEVTHERGSAPRPERIRRAFEIWTQNHVYAVDSRMRCVEVRATSSGEVKQDHPFLGTRLVGGQAQTEDSVEMSYPLPRPGSFAVFEGKRRNRRQFSRTSVVDRVVLRMRVTSITDVSHVPSWDDFVED